MRNFHCSRAEHVHFLRMVPLSNENIASGRNYFYSSTIDTVSWQTNTPLD